MAIKTFKPTTPSRRHMTVSAFEGIDKKAKPERSLVESQKKHAGRNSYGRITVRHHGGGNKQKYRNAIYNATGVAIDTVPITPHVLYAEFSKAGLIHDSWKEEK